MVEQILRALLADRNVPVDVTESFLKRLLDRWRNSRDSNVLAYARDSFLEEDLHTTQLAGPPVSGLPKNVRVSRVMRFEDFRRYYSYISHSDAFFTDTDSEFLARRLSQLRVSLDDNVMASSPMGVCWTCLSNELQESSLEEIENGLGLYHLEPGTPLVEVEYTVDSSELRVPTVLDARLQPGFVSKAVSDGAIPRAWDWKYGRWGVSEMVHRSGVSARDVKVRFLGKTSSRFLPAYDGLASFVIPYYPSVENLISQVLRQVVAHRQLEPFLVGKTTILEISPNEFEHLIALLYERRGFNTTITKASRDGGVDVIAISDSCREGCLLIQAKHTRGIVGISVVRELIGARFLAGDEYTPYMLVVATTGRFSKVAKKAEQQHPMHLRLVDYNELQRQLRMLEHIGLTDVVREAVAKSRTADGLTNELR